MTPYQIMLSESQERMLLFVKQGREAEVERVFEKWDLHACAHRRRHRDGLCGSRITARSCRDPEQRADGRGAGLRSSDGAPGLPGRRFARSTRADSRPTDVVLLFSRCWARRPWRASAGSTASTTTWCGLTRSSCRASVPASSGSRERLVRSRCRVDGNGRYCYLDPRQGAMLAVAEAARNVACAGGLPIGATNCLNFGNPERPEIMWQLAEAIAGIGEACRALDVPITGGNVSLYNETDGEAIYPTPIIGVVGVIEMRRESWRGSFPEPGDDIILLGEDHGELGGSESLEGCSRLVSGNRPVTGSRARARAPGLLVRAASDGLSGPHTTALKADWRLRWQNVFVRRPSGATSQFASGGRRALAPRRGDALWRVGVARARVVSVRRIAPRYCRRRLRPACRRRGIGRTGGRHRIRLPTRRHRLSGAGS